jgi:plastocyanin domain-containing protein
MKLIKSMVVVMSLVLGATAVFAAEKAAKTPATGQKADAQRVEISVTSEGFVPATTKVKVGKPVTLVVTRKVDRTCATDIVIKDYGVNKPLPANVPVEVTLTPKKAGAIRYTCAMDMIAGELVAE